MNNPVPVQQSALCETCGQPDLAVSGTDWRGQDVDVGHDDVYGHPFKPVAPSQSVEEARKFLQQAITNRLEWDSQAYLNSHEAQLARSGLAREQGAAIDALIEAVRGEQISLRRALRLIAGEESLTAEGCARIAREALDRQ